MKLDACSDAEFRAIVNGTRQITPFPRGIRVVYQRRPHEEMEGAFGYTEKNRRTFTITISKSLTYEGTVETVLHETAHVLDWRPYHPWTTHHGPTFWVMFGELYCAFHQVK